MSKLYTADRFVTIGGTTAQYVTGTGSLVTFPTIPSGADYIQNQIASAQSANMWISGNAIVNGNLGIGTSTPDYPLTVSGPINVGAPGANLGIILNNVISTAIPSSSIKAIIGTTNSGFGYSAGSLLIQPRTGVSAAIAFATEGSEKMQITSAGNVGIGTITPNIGGWGKAVTLQGVGNAAFEVTDGTVRTSLISAAGSAGYVSTDTDHPLLFRTNSTERMRITNTGNVGIGTTSPGFKLHVVGNAGIGQNTNGTATIDAYSGSAYFGCDGTQITINGSTNNVGIGTTSPNNRLSISGGSIEIQSGAGKIGFNVNDSFTAYGGSIAHYGMSRAGGAEPVAISGYYGVGVFTDGSERMRITNGGKVGIGTTSPTGILGIGTQTGLITTNGITLGGNNSSIEFLGSIFGAGYGLKLYQSGERTLSIAGRANSTVWTDYFTVTDTGAVGIGTTGPTSLLEIAGSAPVLTMNRTSGSFTNTIDFKASGNPVGSIISNSGTGEQRYSIGPSVGWGGYHTFYTDTSERMRITSTGNVGIGTSAPGSKLNIEGGFLRVNGTEADNYFFEGVRTGVSTTLRIYDNSSNIFYDSYSSMLFRANQNGGSGGFIGLFGGNVGIGTADVNRKFVVGGSAGNSIIAIQDANSGYGLGDGFQLQLSSASDAYVRNYENTATIFHTNDTERMRITSDGDVAIGTTASLLNMPGRGNLTINGSSQSILTLANNGVWKSYLFNDGFGGTYLTSSGILVFSTNLGENMRIDNSGNVGIGTTNPVGRLDVRAPGSFTTDTAFRVRNSADSNNLMIINGAGNIGIGTTSPLPSAVLDINSTTQGFLPPRMTGTEMNSISLPATGLVVFNTSVGEICFFNGSTWVSLSPGGGGSTPIKLTSQTLTAASWTLVGDYYTYSFSNSNIDTTCDISVTPQNASYQTAYNANILPYVATASGTATFYAQYPPQANIVVDIVITQTS
jgi:hypothetical protein